eukprot:9023653-Alexandrium_andersonii.AAC.1
MFAASISRRSHQLRAPSAPTGRPGSTDRSRLGARARAASGKAAERCSGPSPLREDLFALRVAWARWSAHGCPFSMRCCLAPERMTTAGR